MKTTRSQILPDPKHREIPFRAGLSTLNGQLWKDNRTVSLRILRDLGLWNASLIRVVQVGGQTITFFDE